MENDIPQKQHYNEHRYRKKSFQAMLTLPEDDLFMKVKEKRKIGQRKKLFLMLIKEEAKRLKIDQKYFDALEKPYSSKVEIPDSN